MHDHPKNGHHTLRKRKLSGAMRDFPGLSEFSAGFERAQGRSPSFELAMSD
jgi:hypothetical protein